MRLIAKQRYCAHAQYFDHPNPTGYFWTLDWDLENALTFRSFLYHQEGDWIGPPIQPHRIWRPYKPLRDADRKIRTASTCWRMYQGLTLLFLPNVIQLSYSDGWGRQKAELSIPKDLNGELEPPDDVDVVVRGSGGKVTVKFSVIHGMTVFAVYDSSSDTVVLTARVD